MLFTAMDRQLSVSWMTLAVEARREGEVVDGDALVGAVDERHRLEEVHLALGEEAVGDAVGEGGAEPV